MKRLIIIALALSFLAVSCHTTKENNIYVNHAKEKDQFKKPAEKKYESKKHSEKTPKK